ncbi:hypothetical protein CR513_01737, partial [Mucuna pruriens]
MEFLELKQGNMFVVNYSSKFEELSRYSPHYQNEDGERSKCMKFINNLHPKIKQDIRKFLVLTNKCRIYEEDNRARATYYKNVGPTKEKRFGGRSHSKTYSALPYGQGGNR